MRALAWDDKPFEYFDLLVKHLERYKINTTVVDKEGEFVEKFLGGSWDLILLDLIHSDSPAEGDSEKVGLRLARRVADSRLGKEIPIFMITEHYERLSSKDVGLPSAAIIKSKSTHPGWMAGEIVNELVKRGIYVDRKRVFLIFGHDVGADGASNRVRHFLEDQEFEVESVSGGNLQVEIAQGLLDKMNECAAFVAVCTPDDARKDGVCVPRGNVLLEIGISMGLSRGLQRLTILQKWGGRIEEQADLPSDLGGVVTIRFEGEVASKFDIIKSRLKFLGLEFRGAEI